jgi:hypothetical protein
VTGRNLLLGVAVLLLGVLNLWQWGSPDRPTQARSSAAAGVFRPDDFQLRVGFAPADAARSGRNLFQLRLPPPPPAPIKPPEVKAEPPPPAPPSKTPEQLAEEAARAELGQIKLVGVVFRGEKGQAFLVKGEQLYMVNTGGRVGERFLVEAIRADSIQLRDPATRVSGQIPVSGK